MQEKEEKITIMVFNVNKIFQTPIKIKKIKCLIKNLNKRINRINNLKINKIT